MINTPSSLQDLRRNIYVKAKAEPSWRFWGLYVHICKMETLREAYTLARKNNGAPGVDGVTFEVIEAKGVEKYLEQIQGELIDRTYVPLRARRREIPKDGGKVRVLSIPAIRDRVVQGALKLIMEPVFEADFQPGSYGYRPKRTAHEAVHRVATAIVQWKTRVIDLDLRAYFDTVRHHLLLEKVARRINDDEVMRLLKLMLTVSGKQGVPQGGVISPLLSNVYLHWFDKLFHRADGPAQWAGAKLVRYADDFVVLARFQGTRLTGWIESKLEGWLGLEINREKTRVVKLREEGGSLDFLGFTFRYDEDLQGRGWRYLNVSPSAKALKKEREKLHEMTDHRQCFKPIPQLIEGLNRHLKGWKNYFDFGYPRQAFRDINWYVRGRLTQHLRRRSQRPFRPPEGVSFYEQIRRFGLENL